VRDVLKEQFEVVFGINLIQREPADLDAILENLDS
jgi:hypothetical protein